MLSEVTIKSWDDLSKHELYAMIQLRETVFIVEQQCPYLDADGKDLKSHHAMIMSVGICWAYARILPPGVSDDEWSIGRVVSHEKVRRKGYGKVVMKACMEWLRNQGAKAVRISAQSYLIEFYRTFGFEAEGEEYLEDNIPHTEMICKLT
ncbi:MAG: GNAT family N-acetyltransferase [Flavobacteriales bacterium]